MAVPAPTDKRFRRSHVSPTRRRRLPQVSRTHLAFAAALFVVVVFGGYRFVDTVLTAEALTITRITLSGSTQLSGDDVRGRLEGLRGLNMITVDLEAWRETVLESPWVEAAAVRRVLPGSIDVAIVERRPMGVGRMGRTLYLVDEHGGVIDEYGPSHGAFDLPVIDGLAARGPGTARGPAVDRARAALAGRLIAALRERPDLAERLSQVDVSDLRNAAVILKGDTALVRVGVDQFVERLQAYLDVASTLRETVPQIDTVDLRFGERVYVRPQASRGAVRKMASGG